jgi:hypothetical protein
MLHKQNESWNLMCKASHQGFQKSWLKLRTIGENFKTASISLIFYVPATDYIYLYAVSSPEADILMVLMDTIIESRETELAMGLSQELGV